MKRLILVILTQALLSHLTLASVSKTDSVFLFSYATEKNNNHNGLHFAWSTDKKNWNLIGNEHAFVRSDYGQWGSQKRMISPYLIAGPNNTWHCVWQLNDKDRLFAHAASTDLIEWGRQSYTLVSKGQNCLRPVVSYDQKLKLFVVVYSDASGQYFRVNTPDFKTYSEAVEVPQTQYNPLNVTLSLGETRVNGQIHRVSRSMKERLETEVKKSYAKHQLNSETTQQDAERFSNLKPVDIKITAQGKNGKPISNMLVGVFFEDLNYAADGGLYAELIQNRGFEYHPADKNNNDKNWTNTHSWSLRGENGSFTIHSAEPIHPNNEHYAVLSISKPGATLVNTGYNGITIKKGEKYHFSTFVKQLENSPGKVLVRLVDKEGKILASSEIKPTTGPWKKVSAVLSASADSETALLEIQPLSVGKLALDMVSLFPEKTFKQRKNGLRKDLAETIADLKPKFLRFPGGCVAHGDGLHNMYRWKNTIGPLESRKPQRNLWGYHQSMGIGYLEYFQFSEDIGAEPLPVVAAGVPCQNSASGPLGGGQQGGIPLSEMDDYIQEILDLIEWANGDVTTTWGKKRAEAGRPEPFNLKYIGVGNEDLITDIFEERFTMIYNAVKKAHPEITVIGTVGPFNEGTDYREGWKIADKLQLPMVDEHYYQTPGWFINNQNFYDNYDRSKSKVYLGEYAAHLPGRPNNIETALAEALYLTAVERNGDVVEMTSYAPLLAKEGFTQWNPDLIYFNNSTVKPTVGYEVQKLYGHNSGSEYLTASIQLSNEEDAVKKRIAHSIVRDSSTGDIIIKLVNLLPVIVNSSIDIKDVQFADSPAVYSLLNGQPTDKNVRPVVRQIPVNDALSMSLPAYSFSVIRLKAK